MKTLIQSITYFNVNGGVHTKHNFSVPSECPHCSMSNSPEFITSSKHNPNDRKSLALLFRCTSCRDFFAVGYVDNQDGTFTPIKYTYSIQVDYVFPDNIETFSPTFKEVYTQALKAEKQGLNQIAGVGYRKSIEFLVKDYLIEIEGKDKDSISRMHLSPAIKELPKDNLITLALASVWLGNDEAHYVRKIIDKDLIDMKKFIDALVYHISSELVVYDASNMLDTKSDKGSKNPSDAPSDR